MEAGIMTSAVGAAGAGAVEGAGSDAARAAAIEGAGVEEAIEVEVGMQLTTYARHGQAWR
jgi:hypothetical protein